MQSRATEFRIHALYILVYRFVQMYANVFFRLVARTFKRGSYFGKSGPFRGKWTEKLRSKKIQPDSLATALRIFFFSVRLLCYFILFYFIEKVDPCRLGGGELPPRPRACF